MDDEPALVEGAEVDGAAAYLRAIDLEGEQVLDHFEPRPAFAGLRLGIIRRIDEIQLRFLHDDAPDNLARALLDRRSLRDRQGRVFAERSLAIAESPRSG